MPVIVLGYQQNHSKTFASQSLNCTHQLFAKPDSIALRNKHHPVECIGNDKYGQRILMLQLHVFHNLCTYAVTVDTINHC